MNSLNLNFIKQTGMSEYFKFHISLLGVETEALCFTAYHWGQWGLSRFRYGERVVAFPPITQVILPERSHNDEQTKRK